VTSDPEFDTPLVLGRYASKFGADTNRWQFVTGSRESIRNLATTQLKLVLAEKPEAERQGPDDLFLHSTLAVVVDGKGRLRAVVELLEAGGVETVLEALRALEREE
jgi:protein SCO1/2